jgi:hypothetical protein
MGEKFYFCLREHRLKAFEYKVLKEMFRWKKDEMILVGGKKNVHNKELHNLYMYN